jgi:3-hydroxyisobutyrate dehydrogenase
MGIKRIGFVGLGAMGQGQARNLAKAGFEVAGYDIDAERVASFAAAGGIAAASPAEAARGADLFIVLVFDAAQAEEVLFADNSGAVGALPAGVPVVLHTTGSADDARRVAARLAAAGHAMLDAPVTGGKSGADQGTLTVIVSGPDAAFETALPAFEAMGRRVTRVGTEAGQASTVKMINQLLVGVHTAATAEALTLAVKAGADPEKVVEVIVNGAGNSVAFAGRAPQILDRDFDVRGAISILVKDLGIVTDAGRRFAVPLPLASAALQQYLAAVAQGRGQDDLAALVKVYETAAGTTVERKR